MEAIELGSGRIWVITLNDSVVGYAAIAPVPGLPHMADLYGFIVLLYQNQGLGTQLLNHLIAQLPATPFRQLSFAVPALDAETAVFLQHRGFYLEHTELTLTRVLPFQYPVASSPKLSFGRYSKAKSAFLFSSLYDQSFAGLSWHQPYTPAEVKRRLFDPADILFLLENGNPIGFAWLHANGEIEPVGIVKEAQGKGNGRFLLQTALHQLSRRNCPTASLTVWQNNEPALHLYKSLGFQPVETRYYLAYNLEHH